MFPACADIEAMSRLAISYADRVGAGRSAEAHYHARYRAWRARTRLVSLVAMLPVPLLTLAYVSIWPAYRLFAFGTAVGSTITFALTITLVVPERVERWRWGAEAEKRTARRLRRLARRGWMVMHDLPGRYGNRDHVVVAPSGEIFLLDTKAPGGRVTVEHGVLRVRWLEDPDDGYEKDLTPRMKGAAAGLADDLAQALPRRPWVTPVVVIWGRWDGAPHKHSGVAWVPGKALAERLSANVGSPDHARQARVVEALRARVAAAPRA